MSENQKHLIFCIVVSIICFLAISNSIFPYTIMLVKGILFLIGLICGLGFFGCLSQMINKKEPKEEFKKKETIYDLIFRSGIKTSIVNLLTVYRIIVTPVLLILVFNDSPAFKWLLLSAFFTDALDGFLARRFKVVSKLGAKLDSLADDFLFSVSLFAIIYLHSTVIIDHLFFICCIIFVFLVKMILLWFKHDTIISGLHTYCTKAAAFLQAVFFLHCFFFQPNTILFNITACITIVALVEEIIIISSFKQLRNDVKGLFFSRSQM